MTKNDKVKKTHINNWIKSSQCIVIMPDGSGTKTMATPDAIDLAKSQNLDLVEISFNKSLNLPVCKIMNFGKWQYQQTKSEKELKNKNKPKETKTIQFGLMVDDNDKKRLLKKARELLEKGDNVKISIRFKNRNESNNSSYIKIVADSIIKELSDIAEMLPGSKPSKAFRDFSFIMTKIKSK